LDVFLRWLHLLAAAFWFGGLVMLAIVTFSALSLLDRPTFRALIRRVGRAFLIGSVAAWAVLALSGVVMAAGRLHRLSELSSTAFGRTLTAKTVLFILAIAATIAHTVAGGRSSKVAIRLSRTLSPLILLLTLAIFYLAVRLADG
jgi:putative copper export protein